MWKYDCVELDTSAVPLVAVASSPSAAPQRLSLGLYAPGTTAAQRQLGLLAALAAFEAAGLSPAAAATAPGPLRDRCHAAPSPAQIRAIAIWKWATRAAQGACYSAAVAPAQAQLFITTQAETSAEPPGLARHAMAANGDRAGYWSRPAGEATGREPPAASARHGDLNHFSFPADRGRHLQLESLR